ncbi:MAG: DNA polymerase I, partial [Nitrospirae bacterium]|nr:DNA polymerase I [Nitrospirota bacterium]
MSISRASDRLIDMEQFPLFDHEIEQAHAPRSVFGSHCSLSEISFDVEATGSDPFVDYPVGIALCREKDKAYYIPLRHSEGLNFPDALNILKDMFEDESIAKIGHNLKYDMCILRYEGIRVRGVLYDTMVASYLLNPNKPNHSLEDTSIEYLSHRKKPFKEALGKRESFADVPIDEACPYAAEDAELAMELKEILFERLKDEGLDELYFKIEMPLIYVLADMEEAGMKIDMERLRDISKELEVKIHEL